MSPSKQQSMFKKEKPPTPKLEFDISEEVAEPPIWISRIEIWESLDADEPIRVVNLQRGLNIVWAPDVIPEGEEVEGPPETITGHCAGKSLFTRLLRYCLGEKTFAPKEVQLAIRDEFNSGYVFGEIHLDGNVWAVARPLGNSRKSYAKKNGTLNELLMDPSSRSDYEEFRSVLDDRINSFPVGLIPGRQMRPIKWPMQLAWAARDQYCHFENIHTWRSPRSGSEPLSFEKPKEDPVFLIRLLLGLITGDEVGKEELLAETQQKLFQLAEDIKEKKREPEYWHAHYRRELHRLLDIDPEQVIPIKSDNLFTRTYDKRIKEAEEKAEAFAAEKRAEIRPLKNKLEPLDDRLHGVKTIIQDFNNLLASAGKPYEEVSGILRDLNKTQEDIDKWQKQKCLQGDISFKHCEHVKKRIDELRVIDDRDRPINAEEAQVREAALQKIKNELKGFDEEKKKLESEVEEIGEQIKAIEKAANDALGPVKQMKEHLDKFTTWNDVLTGKTPDSDLAELIKLENDCEQKIENLKVDIHELRSQHDENLTKLCSIYDVLCKNVIGPETSGNITLKGDAGLVAELKQRAAFDSPGIDPLKVILFDLAALIFGVEGHGYGTGFLVHDSPREADLGWSLYSSYLRVAKALETPLGGKKGCAFQYVVTTTTKPPESLQDEPYCVLKLDASKEDGKLLKRDFGG